MSCERYREKLKDALLRGEAVLDAALAAHLRSCADCREFYEAQKRLLSAMDLGVRAMVNEEMPASLLPEVRVRMEAVEVAWAWPAWQVLAAGVVVALALVILVPLARWHFQTTRPKTLSRAAAAVPGPGPLKPSEPIVLSMHPPQRRLPTMGTLSKPEAVPQEAILSTGQAAVPRFASGHPEEMAEVVRAAGLEPMDLSKPIEIAPLKFENIELAPLVIETED